jgi:hypothetical protein
MPKTARGVPSPRQQNGSIFSVAGVESEPAA